MVLSNENCPEKRAEAGEDSEPMVPKESKKVEVAKMQAEELEVIVEDPSSSIPTVKTKVRIKVLTIWCVSRVPLLLFVMSGCVGWQDAALVFLATPQPSGH